MKITFISDTHGLHDQLELPETDMLIHAGDLSSRGTVKEILSFLDWFKALPIRHKIFIGGNHDFLLEKEPAVFRQMLTDDYVYLEDEMVEIEGIKIWGSPITPYFFNWAFNRSRGSDIRKYWDMIPDGIDILVTHGPALGMQDKTARGEMVGCEDLLAAIKRVKPSYHVFGHIHEAYGIRKEAETTFVNASVVNLAYQVVNAPTVVEIKI